jgi:RNA polymerase sigma factor (sigma-70 family)
MTVGVGRYRAAVDTDDREEAGVASQPPSVTELVERAANGDEGAWRMLVDRYSGLVWSIVRGFRLDHAAAADAAQTVWLRLVQGLEDVRDPNRLAGWLATTARRECLRALRTGGREIPSEHQMDQPGTMPPAGSPEEHLLGDERQRELWRAVSSLSQRCQLLLRTIAYEPDHSYQEISAALAMPIGSIGPTRSRCLTQLRSILEAPDVDKRKGS